MHITALLITAMLVVMNQSTVAAERDSTMRMKDGVVYGCVLKREIAYCKGGAKWEVERWLLPIEASFREDPMCNAPMAIKRAMMKRCESGYYYSHPGERGYCPGSYRKGIVRECRLNSNRRDACDRYFMGRHRWWNANLSECVR